MSLLIASLVPLLAGPILVRLLDTSPRTARGLDGFVVTAMAGLILLHVMPEALHGGGLAALGAMVVGLLLPMASDRVLHGESGGSRARTITAVVAVIALALHATMDGVALGLGANGHTHGDHLGFAVVLHRIPVGLAIWWLLRPRMGLTRAILAVATIAGCTVLGFFVPHGIEAAVSDRTWAIVTALVAGALAHVVLGHHFTHRPPEDRGTWRPWSAVGGLLAIALMAALSLPGEAGLHEHAESHEASETFIALALASALPMLIAYILAGALHAFFPERSMRWVQKGPTFLQAIKGTLVGMPMSICSCAVIPIYRSLVARGISGPAAVAFLIAAPEIGVASILLSLRLLGLEIGLVRIGVAMVAALAAGVILGRAAARTSESSEDQPLAAAGPKPPFKERLRGALRFGLGEVVDDTIPWVLAGLVVASIVGPLIDADALARLPDWLDVPLLALVGMPVYVCASGSTPFAAVLIGKGISLGGAIAFLLTGPATNVTTFGILAQAHGRRFAISFGVVVASLAIGLGWLTNFLVPAGLVVPIENLAHESTSTLDAICLGLLGLLLVVSLLRQGVEGFVGKVFSTAGGCTDDCCEQACHCDISHDDTPDDDDCGCGCSH